MLKKKGLTKLCLYEIMMAGFDSELAGGGAECGVPAGPTARRGSRPNAGKPAVQTNRDEIGSFSPAYHLLLQVTVCQRRMLL